MEREWSCRYDTWAVVIATSDTAHEVMQECVRLSATYSGPEGEGFVVVVPHIEGGHPFLAAPAEIERLCAPPKQSAAAPAETPKP